LLSAFFIPSISLIVSLVLMAFFVFVILRPLAATLFPYTTLFRSVLLRCFFHTAQREQCACEHLRGLTVFRLQVQDYLKGLNGQGRLAQTQTSTPEEKPPGREVRLELNRRLQLTDGLPLPASQI